MFEMTLTKPKDTSVSQVQEMMPACADQDGI